MSQRENVVDNADVCGVQMLRLPRTDPAASLEVDIPRVLDAFMHAVRGLAALHAAGTAHGDISDATLLLSRGATAGGAVTVRFGTLGRLGGPAPTLEQLADVRRDLPVFVAPEVLAAGPEAAACPEADVWALAVVLAYCLRPTLPHVADGPLVCPPSCFLHCLQLHVCGLALRRKEVVSYRPACDSVLQHSRALHNAWLRSFDQLADHWQSSAAINVAIYTCP